MAGQSTYIQNGQEPGAGILQPDYQFSHNGYGLVQLVANYAIDMSTAGSSAKNFPRGGGFQGGTGDLDMALTTGFNWTVVKAEEKGRDGVIAYTTVHYAAIDPNKGSFTETEASMTSAVVSEPIESHPNFTKVQAVGIGDGSTPLGGVWNGNIPPDPTDTAKNKFRAQWGPITSAGNVGAVTYNFLGFLPAPSGGDPNRKAGVRSWMRPTINLKMTAYTDDPTSAALACSYIGMIVKSNVGFLEIPEAYTGIGQNGLLGLSEANETAGRNWLVTGANMEVYGGLYKVTADLLLSGVLGWDKDIYCDAS